MEKTPPPNPVMYCIGMFDLCGLMLKVNSPTQSHDDVFEINDFNTFFISCLIYWVWFVAILDMYLW